MLELLTELVRPLADDLYINAAPMMYAAITFDIPEHIRTLFVDEALEAIASDHTQASRKAK